MCSPNPYIVSGKVIGREEIRRPFLDVNSDHEFTHNGDKCRVVMRRNKISVGCSDISPKALKELVRLYEKSFPADPGEVVIQD